MVVISWFHKHERPPKVPHLYEALVGPADSKRLDIYYLEQTEELLDRARFRLTAAATGLPSPRYPTGVVTAEAAGAAGAGMRIMRRKRCCACRATMLAAALAAAMPKGRRKEGRQWRPQRRISEAD